jgi:hypothetical protein
MMTANFGFGNLRLAFGDLLQYGRLSLEVYVVGFAAVYPYQVKSFYTILVQQF